MARKLPQSVSAPPREATIGDNGAPDETATLLSIINKLHPAMDAVETAKATVKSHQAVVTTIFRTAKAAGFPRGELEELVEDIRRKDTREQQEREQRRNRWRRIVNLPMGETDELELANTPQEARDELYWAAEGYRAGLTGMPRTLPDKIQPRMDAIWDSNWVKGRDESHKLIAANLKKPPTTAEIAAADFASDNPEVDIAKAAKKLKNDSKFMDRSAPEEIVDEDPLGVGIEDDGFEASEEELAAQSGRPVHESEIV